MNKICCFLLPLVWTHFLSLVNSQSYDFPVANLSTTWTNNNPSNFIDGSKMSFFLLRATHHSLGYACGFYCKANCNTSNYIFAIFIMPTTCASYMTCLGQGVAQSVPRVVWSANRNNPVRINATMRLTTDGILVLRDADGTIAWSTDTGGKSVAGINLTEMGNLVLFDDNNSTVWNSFDYPTDTLVPGQKLVAGQKLTAIASETNWTQQGLLSLSLTNQGLFASIDSDPPQTYFSFPISGTKMSNESSYVRFLNGSLALFILSAEPSQPDGVIRIPAAVLAQYITLEPDGHLRVHEFSADEWTEVADLFAGYLGECDYPLVCGNYGICSTSVQCSCPASTSDGASYFKPIKDTQPDLGCSTITPLSCEASQSHSFLELKNVTYFAFDSDLNNTDSESCKQVTTNYSSTSVYIKVQNVHTAVTNGKENSKVKLILGSTIGVFAGLLSIVGVLLLFVRRSKNAGDAEEVLDQVPGMPTRFSYEHLKVITQNFSKVLGEGGFGTVFEGTLFDGTKVAVKRLDGLGQIKKSFLAEVDTIGSIHHVNLVRLIGFCSATSHRLLVYEYMCNGSLDRWIFHKSYESVLSWQQRKKIILDIAKGLTYLHEDCRQKIVHLDIKPQNVLLDEDFNAKVADFGLSKLIQRDQSHFEATIRGTPGYMAPEWLSSVITEKVDVYSFGVVILEMLCGRKNLDRSQPEEEMHLLKLFEQKTKEGRLPDLVDRNSEDMQLHGAEVVNMMRVAAWCLQGEFAKRPSMSVVVKVLEGVMDVEHNLDYRFAGSLFARTTETVGYQELYKDSETTLSPSILSGPR
ncbi:Pkinase domain-containing protein/B_lectin domain-containing protein [Cephalotus follicularis]|uniref:Receptor-like serine/threonine-protein kinase n=1 Tax=Cephalotus follicularis TaxID=3775 RepID=A0A1Q3C295_CEPFO|nr:Pkinase domain-containing protein/B_lectin domain-containing protein [Cephalotus follicularis]